MNVNCTDCQRRHRNGETGFCSEFTSQPQIASCASFLPEAPAAPVSMPGKNGPTGQYLHLDQDDKDSAQQQA